jgi:hypothetical protein
MGPPQARRDVLSRLHPAAQAAIAAGLALLLALVSIKAWRLSLSVPFEYVWDSVFHQFEVKSVLDNTTYLTNDYIGAPFGGQLYDFPQGDNNLHFALIKLLGIFSGDSAVVMNVFWLLTFPLTAVAAWWAFRRMGLGPLPAIVCAVLFSILPYHYWRGEGHLWLSAYYAVPLGCFFVLQVLQRRRIFEGRRTALLGAGAACIVIGSANVYYAVFTALLLLGAAVLVAWERDGRRPARDAVIAIALIATTLVANLAPSIDYRASHGDNPEVAQRTPIESEMYGLTLIGMLLPANNHRAEPLADIKAHYLGSTLTPGESAQSLGLIGAIGLVVLFVLVARSALRPSRASGRPLLRAAAVGAVMAFVIGTIGGVSEIFARAVDPQIRAWSRLSVFIGFFALIAVGTALGWLYARLERRSHGSFAVAGATVAILAFALWDQTPPAHIGQFDRDYIEPQYESDEAFVELLEERLPGGAAVLQLPYLKFPEGYPPPGRMSDFDPLRGYLHSEDLRWSYGAMNGRSADVTACLAGAEPQVVAPTAKAMGFDAIWLDRFGYADSGMVEADLQRVTRASPWESPDSRFLAYDLRAVEPRKRLEAEIEDAMPDSGDELQDCGPLEKVVG